MIYRNDDDTGPELPPELAELDRELASIQIHERPSFAPELKAELERAWARPRLGRRHRVGQAMAAAVATLMFGGLLVPQARASLGRMLPWYRVEASVEGTIPEPEPVRPTAVQPEATPVVIPNRPEPVDLPPLAFPTPDLGPEIPFEFADVAFPELIDRDAAVRAIQEHYPVSLQEQGVGGLITVRAWVTAEGAADDVPVAQAFPSWTRWRSTWSRLWAFGRLVGQESPWELGFNSTCYSSPLPSTEDARPSRVRHPLTGR